MSASLWTRYDNRFKRYGLTKATTDLSRALVQASRISATARTMSMPSAAPKKPGSSGPASG